MEQVWQEYNFSEYCVCSSYGNQRGEGGVTGAPKKHESQTTSKAANQSDFR